MKKTILNVVMLTAILVTSAAVMADKAGKVYVGAQYAITSYKDDDFDEFNPTAFIGKVGGYPTDNIALEWRAGTGIQKDSINILGSDLSLKTDTLFGMYGVGHLNLGETSSLYGLIGFTHVATTVSLLGQSETASDDGFSFGVGADIGFGGNVALNIEYIQYLNESDYVLNALSFGLIFYN